MSLEEKRKDKRRPFIKPLRYYLATHLEKLKKMDCDGISVDISRIGLGMITDYPLEAGSILIFEDEIKTNIITAKASIVRWALEIENNRYRVGLEFLR